MTNWLLSEVFFLVCIFTTEACKLWPKSGRSRGGVPGANLGKKRRRDGRASRSTFFIFIVDFWTCNIQLHRHLFSRISLAVKVINYCISIYKSHQCIIGVKSRKLCSINTLDQVRVPSNSGTIIQARFQRFCLTPISFVNISKHSHERVGQPGYRDLISASRVLKIPKRISWKSYSYLSRSSTNHQIALATTLLIFLLGSSFTVPIPITSRPRAQGRLRRPSCFSAELPVRSQQPGRQFSQIDTPAWYLVQNVFWRDSWTAKMAEVCLVCISTAEVLE